MLAVVAAMGCSATVDTSAVLRVSPSEVAMTVDLSADRGIISPAFHLPGQGTLSMLHGPLALP